MLTELIIDAKNTWLRSPVLALDKAEQHAAIRKLNKPRVLSVRAIAAITGSTVYAVKKAIGTGSHPEARGALNPQHLAKLGLVLAGTEEATPGLIKALVHEGTSVSTISDLTNISRSTLYRRLEQ